MSFRYSLTWLHTWSGLLLGWLLYFMFITGSAGYFDSEIDRWMQPEIPILEKPFDTETQLQKAQAHLNRVAPNADHLYIEFPVGRSPFFSLWWHNPKNTNSEDTPGWHNEKLNPNTAEPVITRHTEGGEFLYRLHYTLHYIPAKLGYWITSLAAMFMLVALISGIIIHKRIFKDFFTIRRKKPQRFWLDTHNLFSVLALPFHIMITYSGLMLLMLSTMIAVTAALFGADEEKLKSLYDSVFSEPEHREPAGIQAEGAPLISVFEKALKQINQHYPKSSIAYIGIDHPGDKHASIEFGATEPQGLKPYTQLHFDAATAEQYFPEESNSKPSAILDFYFVMEALHEGLFAPPILRWLYFLSGLMGAAMVASGTILWATKRKEKHNKSQENTRALTWVECLNIGTIVGLPIAIAAYFWANRLLPVELETRATWEMHSLFLVWLLALLHPFLLCNKVPAERLWIQQLIFATCAFGFIPVLNALTTNIHLGNSVAHGDWVLAGFDVFMMVMAFAFFALAKRIHATQDRKQ